MSNGCTVQVEWHGIPAVMTYHSLLTELVYQSYRTNRQAAPMITPADWRQTIPEFTEAMETRYRKEQGIE